MNRLEKLLDNLAEKKLARETPLDKKRREERLLQDKREFKETFINPGKVGRGDYIADAIFAGGVGLSIPAAIYGAYSLLFLGAFAAVSGAILRGIHGYVRWYYQKGPGKLPNQADTQTNQ